MNDARGRPIEVGDAIALPAKGETQEGAILGFAQEVNDKLVHLGDGVTYGGHEIVTLGGWMWYICLDCNAPIPVDTRGGVPTCSVCQGERLEAEGVSVSYYTAAELLL